MTTERMRTMRLALIGTGKIVKEVLEAVKNIETIELSAIWTRPHSLEVAEKLAGDYKIASVSTDYAKLLKREDVDFVYIGLINSVHYEYAKQALEAGKHVIMEKPFCATEAETVELTKLAVEKNLFLFDAVSFLYMPNFFFLEDHIKKIGKIKLVQANYSQYSSRYDDYRNGVVQPAFDPAAYGGALYDINFYNITLCMALFGKPDSFAYTPNLGFNGVDTSGIMHLNYPGFQAVCTGAKDSESPGFFIVQGEDGWLKVEGTPNMLPKVIVKQQGRAERVVELNGDKHRLTHEFVAFDRFFVAKRYDIVAERLTITQNVIHIIENSHRRMLKKEGFASDVFAKG